MAFERIAGVLEISVVAKSLAFECRGNTGGIKEGWLVVADQPELQDFMVKPWREEAQQDH